MKEPFLGHRPRKQVVGQIWPVDRCTAVLSQGRASSARESQTHSAGVSTCGTQPTVSIYSFQNNSNLGTIMTLSRLNSEVKMMPQSHQVTSVLLVISD